MFCKNCGALLDDNARFCPECGTKTESNGTKTESKEFPTTCNTSFAPTGDAPLALAVAGFVLTLSGIFCPIGLIISAIARGKIKKYFSNGGTLTSDAKTANTLSKVGLILGIIFIGVPILLIFVLTFITYYFTTFAIS